MSSNHHKIKAVLLPNQLKNNEGTYKAQTIAYRTLGIKDICQSLCNKPGTGVDPDAMEYHVRLFLEEMGELPLFPVAYKIRHPMFGIGSSLCRG